MPEKRYDLDHTLELHVVRDANDQISPTGVNTRARKEKLREDLKEIVNGVENLNFTTPEVNQTKFEGTYKFQEDYTTLSRTSSTLIARGALIPVETYRNTRYSKGATSLR